MCLPFFVLSLIRCFHDNDWYGIKLVVLRSCFIFRLIESNKKKPIGNFEEWNESRRLRARAFAHSFATFNRFVCNAACYIVLYALDELLLYRTALCLNPRNQLIHTHCELRNNYIWKLLTWRVHTFKCLRVSFCFVSGFFSLSLSFYFSLFLVHFFEAQFSHSSLYFFVFFLCRCRSNRRCCCFSLFFYWLLFYWLDANLCWGGSTTKP